MKAIVKETGKKVEVLKNSDMYYCVDNGMWYRSSELYFIDEEDEEDTLDYWTRLEHQYAGMAMQGLVTRGEVLGSSVQEIARDIAEISCEIAHALVEKMKEEK